MPVIYRFLCSIALATAALAANQPDTLKTDTPAKPAYPNIVLITVDTTRADRMGFLGSKRGLTPHLDALAKDSAVFTHAYSQAPLTPTSHATILTGTYPQFHQVITFQIPLSKNIPYMPEILKAQGYSTAAFIGSIALDPAGAPGFDRGFDLYDAGFSWEGYTPKTRYQTTERRGGEVVARALDWLSKHPQGPFFIWLHLYDPHEPYEPPQPFKTRYAKEPYDGEIAYADSALGKLFAQLKASGLYDGALIAVASDHGESLGAHGEERHGIFLYDETIHVPLLIKLPHSHATSKRVDDLVELADVMPTLLQVVGISVPEKVQGQSLLGFVEPGTAEGKAAAKAWHDRGAYSQSDYGHVAFAWSAIQSSRNGKYLYVQAPRRELYDEKVDAKAEHNLATSAPAVADTLAAKMKDFRAKTTNTDETPKAKMDAATAKKLAALGYVSRRNEVSASVSDEGADPKDKIATVNLVHRINQILQDWHCDRAIPEIKKGLLKDPSNSMLHFFLGGCYLEAKDYAKSAPELRESVRLDPGFTHAEMNLGRALMKIQDYKEATTAFEHVTVLEPNLMDAHVYLVVLYARLDRVPEEIKECRRVLEVVPEHFGSNLNLGQFLAKSGDLNGAIPSLQKAASIRPTNPLPHIYLADVYAKLGRAADAANEREQAEALGAVPKDRKPPAPDEGPDTPGKQFHVSIPED